jgi:hypothetical protein
MIVYTPSAAAETLTQLLWTLTDPDPTRGTAAMFPVITALDGSKWLQVNTEFSVPVHPDAILDGIADILQPWIDGGQLPADTNEVLAALVEAKRGQRLVVWEAFPNLFQSLSKTYSQMIDAGLLSEPAGTP